MRIPVIMATIVGLVVFAACGGGKNRAPSTSGAAVAVAVTSTAAAGAEPFRVLSSTAFVSGADTFEIAGEVQNNSGKAAGAITVTVVLLDAKQRPVQAATTETTALRTVTPPGETTPFDYLEPNGRKLNGKVVSYQVTADGQTTDLKPVQGLTVSGEKVTTSQGGYTLTGHVTNIGATAVKTPEVIATFYDATGKVVRVGEGVFSADAFAPGEGDDFSFGFLDGARIGIARYVLATQAEQ